MDGRTESPKEVLPRTGVLKFHHAHLPLPLMICRLPSGSQARDATRHGGRAQKKLSETPRLCYQSSSLRSHVKKKKMNHNGSTRGLMRPSGPRMPAERPHCLRLFRDTKTTFKVTRKPMNMCGHYLDAGREAGQEGRRTNTRIPDSAVGAAPTLTRVLSVLREDWTQSQTRVGEDTGRLTLQRRLRLGAT